MFRTAESFFLQCVHPYRLKSLAYQVQFCLTLSVSLKEEKWGNGVHAVGLQQVKVIQVMIYNIYFLFNRFIIIEAHQT